MSSYAEFLIQTTKDDYLDGQISLSEYEDEVRDLLANPPEEDDPLYAALINMFEQPLPFGIARR